MSDKFKFWTHGVSVIPEYTKELTGDVNRGLYMRPTGYGTIVRQKAGTWNWFHFAIPTPTSLDGAASRELYAWLRADINNEAVIKTVNIHETRTGKRAPRIYSSGNINYTGRSDTFDFNLTNAATTGPLVMSVLVQFETDRGEILFGGAGVLFEER